MAAPELSPEQIASAIPGIDRVEFLKAGGQKAVFVCTIDGGPCALKILAEELDTADEAAEATARARREVETLRECESPYLVKLGTRGLTRVEIDDSPYLYFTEEFVDGLDVADILRANGPMPGDEVARLAMEVSSAIACLWERRKIHRDVKPGNIMRRKGTGQFVLLDVGIVYDVRGESITQPGGRPGTPAYRSPEQLDPWRKRQMDLRSDLFSLGVVMYETLTATHPFLRDVHSAGDLEANIVSLGPAPPSSIVGSGAAALDGVVMRLMAKEPHQRYRTCEHVQAAIRDSGAL